MPMKTFNILPILHNKSSLSFGYFKAFIIKWQIQDTTSIQLKANTMMQEGIFQLEDTQVKRLKNVFV